MSQSTTAPAAWPSVAPVPRARWMRRHAVFLFLAPAVALFVGFVAYPILWLVEKSVLRDDQNGVGSFVGIGNYLSVLHDPVFWLVLRNMALWAAITIPVQMLVGGVIAWFIERHTTFWRPFFRTMFFLPVVTSVSVVSLVWVQIYAPYYGIAQAYLQVIGITLTDSMLGSSTLAIYALIIVNVWQWTGFSMLMYIAGIANLPSEVLDAARIDGARGLKLARSVVVPMLAPVTKSLLLLGIIGTLQTFPIVQLMTGGGPNHASEVFGTDIFRESFVLGDTNIGATLSMIVLAIALVLTIAQIVFLGTSVGRGRIAR
jgi:ABC-type sugar transport system permease subunit